MEANSEFRRRGEMHGVHLHVDTHPPKPADGPQQRQRRIGSLRPTSGPASPAYAKWREQALTLDTASPRSPPNGLLSAATPRSALDVPANSIPISGTSTRFTFISTLLHLLVSSIEKHSAIARELEQVECRLLDTERRYRHAEYSWRLCGETRSAEEAYLYLLRQTGFDTLKGALEQVVGHVQKFEETVSTGYYPDHPDTEPRRFSSYVKSEWRSVCAAVEQHQTPVLKGDVALRIAECLLHNGGLRTRLKNVEKAVAILDDFLETQYRRLSRFNLLKADWRQFCKIDRHRLSIRYLLHVRDSCSAFARTLDAISADQNISCVAGLDLFQVDVQQAMQYFSTPADVVTSFFSSEEQVSELGERPGNCRWRLTLRLLTDERDPREPLRMRCEREYFIPFAMYAGG
jgi:hypothetical protein